MHHASVAWLCSHKKEDTLSSYFEVQLHHIATLIINSSAVSEPNSALIMTDPAERCISLGRQFSPRFECISQLLNLFTLVTWQTSILYSSSCHAPPNISWSKPPWISLSVDASVRYRRCACKNGCVLQGHFYFSKFWFCVYIAVLKTHCYFLS